MPLLKGGRLVADPWIKTPSDAALPERAPAIVPFARFTAARAPCLAHAPGIGVRCSNTDPIAVLAPDIGQIGLIALEFPSFRDGRAFSQARVLRERLGFRGELRATGEVLADQLRHMWRCGFDAFELMSPDPEGAWLRALGAYRGDYQPATVEAAPLITRLRLLGPLTSGG